MKVNHRANFEAGLLESKSKMKPIPKINLFECNQDGNYISPTIDSAWCGYTMAVFDITGEFAE